MSGGAAAVGAIASLVSTICAIVVLIIYFVAIANKPPKLVCTYSFKISSVFNVTPSGTLHWYNESWYSNEDTNNVAFVTSEPDKWTKILYADDRAFVMQSWFNRTLCIAQDASGGCFGMSYGVEEQKWQHPCPGNETRMCDVWSAEDDDGNNETWYLLPKDDDGTDDGRVPMGFISKGSYGTLQSNFTRITLAEPDSSVFVAPAMSACFDLDASSKKRFDPTTFARHRLEQAATAHFHLRPNTGERVWTKLADQLVNPVGATDQPEGGDHWTARRYKQWDGMTYKQLGQKLMWPSVITRMTTPKLNNDELAVVKKLPKSAKDVTALPTSFDATEKWGTCATVTSIRDQDQCGSCWAFATAEVLADRQCAAHGSSVHLSPQYIMDCYGTNGCGGGYTDVGMLRLKQNGTVSEACMPYHVESRECRKTCESGSGFTQVYKANNIYTLYANGVASETAVLMQQDLYDHGPLGVSFYVYSDFYDYESGVYEHKRSATLQGMHAVKLVGWGVENGVAFWKVANSWGPSWGESGFFRIARGVNECAIEEMVFSGTVA